MEPPPRRRHSPRGSSPRRLNTASLGGALMNHILVVDDEAEIRTSLEEILREEGYGVATAATAAEAMVAVAGRAL
jgi:PleD family two-component response regulator